MNILGPVSDYVLEKKLLKKGILVKKTSGIRSLKNMDILCIGKTGVLTEEKFTLTSYFDGNMNKDDRVLELGLICSNKASPIDASIWAYAQENNFYSPRKFKKIAEVPLNHNRMGMFSVIESGDEREFIYKGAPRSILEFCRITGRKRGILLRKAKDLNTSGFQVIAVASRPIEVKLNYSFLDVKSLTFVGFLTYFDPPKLSAKEAIDRLNNLGVKVKIVTGDNETITHKVCEDIGLKCESSLTGSQIEDLSDSDLTTKALDCDLFTEITLDQKVRLLNALKLSGHTIGFLGDDVDDVAFLESADVGISVDSADHETKDAALVILPAKNLSFVFEACANCRNIFK